ncbi:MAG TPA: phosphatase PAP2 family protein, partial [Myxococcota bacterium]|nr:phosphatase PAP2 family protein [Myxococcota bacterium]
AALIGIPVRYNYVIRWEHLLFGWVPKGLPTLALQAALLQPGRWGPVDYGTVLVYISYFVVPPAMVAALWLWWPHCLRPYVTATLALFTVAGVINFCFPTAPPWYAALHSHLPSVVQLGRAIVGEISSPAYRYGSGISGNAVAAMPSVHIGVVALLACAFWRTPLRWISLAYLAAMSFAVVYGGDHYVVDVLAGGGLALLLWRGAERRAVTAGSRMGERGEDRTRTRSSAT